MPPASSWSPIAKADSVKDFLNAQALEGKSHTAALTFDLMTFREQSIMSIADDDGNQRILECNERYYVPSEITWLLKSLGFTTIEIFGEKRGAYSRNDVLTTEDFEMLVVGKK